MEKLEIYTTGKFWSICTNCNEWNWCDNIPFTPVCICRICFEVEIIPKMKAQTVIKSLIKKFYKGITKPQPEEHMTEVEEEK